MQHRRIDRPDLKLDPPRVLERLGQRDLIPGEAGRAHIDGYHAVGTGERRKHAAIGFDADALLAAFSGDDAGDAARRIAAGADLPAVGIPDAHEHVGHARWLERDDLVAADAFLAVGDGAQRVRAERQRTRARVEHDEIVAEPIHLTERYRLSLH